ncbi:MAG: hypothetical protein IPO60_14545 [Flavobacteriales bacterium]|nr:hypothetical protein [Flavobacteriales bacterium]
MARIIPDPSGNQGYFGIGDYFTAATNPSERLDVLNGRGDQELPTNPVSASMEAVVVNTSTGVLFTAVPHHHRWRIVIGPRSLVRSMNSRTANAPAGDRGCLP